MTTKACIFVLIITMMFNICIVLMIPYSKITRYFAWLALHHLHHLMVVTITGFGVKKDNVMIKINVVNNAVYLSSAIWLTCVDSYGTDRFCAYSTQTYLIFIAVHAGEECYSFNRLLQ